jgi:signal transduction histidine kinase
VAVFWRRWLFLVLGGALFTPYAILAMIAVPLAVPGLAEADNRVLVGVLLATLVVTLVGTSWLPVVRTLEAAVVPGLLDGPASGLVVAPVRTWVERRRTMLWYVMHTVVGAVVSLGSVLIPPVALTLIVGALSGEATLVLGTEPTPVSQTWAVPIALTLLVALVLAVWGAGTAAAGAAPRLLGPDPTTRLEELERRTRELTERTRLARELHDSIGHALTVTTLQASAARTVLHTDPAFAERALLAIEQTGRVAAADLDDFLGLLREERAVRTPQPTLREVEGLVTAHRESGLPVQLDLEGDPGQVAAVVSREVYRILQEGLTNVQRHAGQVETCLQVRVKADELTATVRNAAGAATRGGGGGRGLDGIRERVHLLGGVVRAGPDADGWLLQVTVPTGAGR